MQLANDLPRIYAAGAEVVAVSADSPDRSAAFARRFHLPFAIVADPGGEKIIKPLGLWDPTPSMRSNDETIVQGYAIPALLVLDPAGREVFRYVSRDYADRPDDEDAITAIEGLGLDAHELPADASEPAASEDADTAGAFPPMMFYAFFRGCHGAALALAGRVEDEHAKAEAHKLAEVAGSYLAAWRARGWSVPRRPE